MIAMTAALRNSTKEKPITALELNWARFKKIDVSHAFFSSNNLVRNLISTSLLGHRFWISSCSSVARQPIDDPERYRPSYLDWLTSPRFAR